MNKLLGQISAEKQGRLNDIALLVFRVGVGLAMVYQHGFKKLAVVMGDDPIKFADPLGLGDATTMYIAVFAEFVCASLIVIGLFTRWATIPLMITMLVVVFIVKMGQGFGEQEMAFMYLMSLIAIFLMGPGKYSLDYKLSGGK